MENEVSPAAFCKFVIDLCASIVKTCEPYQEHLSCGSEVIQFSLFACLGKIAKKNGTCREELEKYLEESLKEYIIWFPNEA